MTETADGKEVYTTRSAPGQPQKPTERTAAIPAALPASNKEAEADEDDLDTVVPPGTVCKRLGCKVTFVSNEENRNGDGTGTKCVHHPGAVRIFCFHVRPYPTAETIVSPYSMRGARLVPCSLLPRAWMSITNRNFLGLLLL